MDENKNIKKISDEEMNNVSGGRWNDGEYYISDDCIGCGTCESDCPTGSIECRGDYYVIDTDSCIECGTCEDLCPVGAIRRR